MSRALVVVDLGFGDSGKGLVTDYLTRAIGACAVVRFNGGAQAGHNVVTDDGRHHTFSQLGAGTFAGDVVTFLSRFVVVHPTAMTVEADALARKGVPRALERVWVDGDALVTTPFHQALNQVRELARGDARHGTCGVGFGETVRDGRAHPDDALRVRDFLRGDDDVRRLVHLALDRAQHEMAQVLAARGGATPAIERELVAMTREIGDAWVERARAWARQVRIVGAEALEELGRRGPVVFEGAQGVLLDERYGFLPHCTFSTCTPENALVLACEHLPDHEVTRLGVVRTYLTRHGVGPLPTEAPELAALPEPHNRGAGWQGAFRAGWPDLVLWKHAVKACRGLDGLAVTRVDALEGQASWRACAHYEATGAALDAAALAAARPVYDDDFPTSELLPRLEAELGVPIAFRSTGPRASDVQDARFAR